MLEPQNEELMEREAQDSAPIVRKAFHEYAKKMHAPVTRNGWTSLDSGVTENLVRCFDPMIQRLAVYAATSDDQLEDVVLRVMNVIKSVISSSVEPATYPFMPAELFSDTQWRRGMLNAIKAYVVQARKETAVVEQKPVPPQKLQIVQFNEDNSKANAALRQAIVMPILQRRGWSRGRWATKAGVSKNSVYDYLSGKRAISDANRQAMAEVLGLKAEDLPGSPTFSRDSRDSARDDFPGAVRLQRLQAG